MNMPALKYLDHELGICLMIYMVWKPPSDDEHAGCRAREDDTVAAKYTRCSSFVYFVLASGG